MQIFEQTFYNILPNGVKVVLRQTPSDVAYIGVMVGAGTRDEQPEENGMAHYIEHCVFKGTAHHTARQIIRSVEGVGGEINAYTTKEETTFYAATLVNNCRKILGLIAEMITDPMFPQKETDKELGVILDEMEGYNDSPSELIYDDFESLIFANHPLGMPILGTRKTLQHIARDAQNPIQWVKQHYLPERMVVFFQGNITPQKAMNMAQEALGSIESTPSNVQRIACPTDYPKLKIFHKRTHQTHIMLGSRAYPLGHPHQLHLYLLNNILGGGSLNARLNLSLREQRGLVYTVESTYTPLSDTGYWCTYFASEKENESICLHLIYKELRKLKDTLMTPTSLAAALRQLRGQMAISAENQENNALAMAKSVLYFGRAPRWEDTYEKICQTTPEDLQTVANEIFDEDAICLLKYV